jgi:regulator of protease activity HflC (stomatin/prohibitin superfamily)
MKKEFTVKPISGYLALLVALLLIGSAIAGFAFEIIWLGAILTLLFIFTLIGFTVVNPNESCVMVLFGAYNGTIRENGFFWVNPFYIKRKLSLRARNFDSEPIKVNDKIGNPIKIGFVLVWRVSETYKAVFEVDDYQHFVWYKVMLHFANLPAYILMIILRITKQLLPSEAGEKK